MDRCPYLDKAMGKKEDFNLVQSRVKYSRNPETIIKMLERNKRSFYLRETSFLTTLIYDNTEISFTKKNGMFPPNQLWIFNIVKKHAENFASQIERGEKEFIMPEKLPTNLTNFDYDDSIGQITGTDINSAYWTIAHRLGIINDEVYNRVSADEFKVVRLAALAILGRDLVYREFKDGTVASQKKVVSGSKMLKEFYKAIRYTCYQHMHTLSQILGNEFDAYRTDCIYYRNTPENIKLVHDYLDEHGFYYKQLVFDEQGVEL